MNETARTSKSMPHKPHNTLADSMSKVHPLAPPSDLFERPWKADQGSDPTAISTALNEDLNWHGIRPFMPESDETALPSFPTDTDLSIFNFASASTVEVPSLTGSTTSSTSDPNFWFFSTATLRASVMASGPPDSSLITVGGSAPLTTAPTMPLNTASFLSLPTPTITASPAIGPQPAVATNSSAASSSGVTTSSSSRITGPIIAAIVVPLVATLLIIVGILIFFRRRRARNKRRARELQKRAEWLDPEYIARVRMEMLGLDPNKVSHVPKAPTSNVVDTTELRTWTGDTANAAVDINAKWMNQGKMSGSIRHIQEQQHVRPLPRTRTTADGSPVQLPYNPNRSRSGGLQRLHSLDQLAAHPQQQPRPNAITDSPSEGEWLSNSALNINPGSKSSLNNISSPSLHSNAAADLTVPPPPPPPPPPPFDPRGSMRECQIGLALSLPWPEQPPRPHHRIPAQSRDYPYPAPDGGEPSLHVQAYKEGALTGDGYDVLWRTNRRRERLALRGPTALEALPQVRLSRRSQGSDELEGDDSFGSQGSGETVVVATGDAVGTDGHSLHVPRSLAALGVGRYARKGKENDARMEALESKVRLLASMGTGDEKVPEMPMAQEERPAKETEVRAAAPAGGNEEVVKSMLRERLGMVKGLFGRG